VAAGWDSSLECCLYHPVVLLLELSLAMCGADASSSCLWIVVPVAESPSTRCPLACAFSFCSLMAVRCHIAPIRSRSLLSGGVVWGGVRCFLHSGARDVPVVANGGVGR
jgi:hypothetical protein